MALPAHDWMPWCRTMRGALTGGARPYAEIGATLGMSEGAVKVAIHRLRRRFQELVRDEVAQTVDGPAEVEEEMRYLRTVLGQTK